MRHEESAALREALEELITTGVLLVSDAALPSVAGLVAEAPVRGSWWAHPQAHAIFRVANALAEHPDVITAKLFSGKVTYVHRRYWGALFAIATSGEPWQMRGISSLARRLLLRVEKEGKLRTDHLPELLNVKLKAIGDAARELEGRLLVYGASVHTEKGSHAKQLESWKHLARCRPITGRRMSAQLAKHKFEEIARRLEERFRSRIKLLWQRG